MTMRMPSCAAEAAWLSCEREALAVALQLVATLGEFHTSAANVLDTEAPRTPAEPEVEFQGREYKAVIVLYLQGGADSYNMLVPHSGCDVGAATSGAALFCFPGGSSGKPEVTGITPRSDRATKKTIE